MYVSNIFELFALSFKKIEMYFMVQGIGLGFIQDNIQSPPIIINKSYSMVLRIIRADILRVAGHFSKPRRGE